MHVFPPFLVVASLLAYEATAECSSWSDRFQTDLDGVCVCTEENCDFLPSDHKNLSPGKVGVYSTTKSGDRLKYDEISIASGNSVSADFVIDVSTKYQEIVGFGGGFTDAATDNIYTLTETLQSKVIDAYFSNDGIGYSLGRVPIASTDFSTYIYSYNDVVDDFEMENFSIDVDREPGSHKLTILKRALELQPDMKLFASSWAPPAWMTRENSTINCHLKGEPGNGEYWDALALYYSKFFDAYKEEGISFWGMTVQNEPTMLAELNAWQSLRLTVEEERDFIKYHLGPMMQKNHPGLNIIAHDDQKGIIDTRMGIFEDEEALQYINGLGVHWYLTLDYISPGAGSFDVLKSFHESYPDLFILGTEACEGAVPNGVGTGAGVKITDPDIIWRRGEIIAQDILGDLNAFASGWTDWNLVLTSSGGYSWADNNVDAMILIDEDSGKECYFQPMYFIMWHIAKFVPAGSRRIALTATEDSWENVVYTAFATPDSSVVALFLNHGDADESIGVQVPGGSVMPLDLPGHSMKTVILPTELGGHC